MAVGALNSSFCLANVSNHGMCTSVEVNFVFHLIISLHLLYILRTEMELYVHSRTFTCPLVSTVGRLWSKFFKMANAQTLGSTLSSLISTEPNGSL